MYESPALRGFCRSGTNERRPYMTSGSHQDLTTQGRKRLLPFFGADPLSKVDEERVREWLATMVELVEAGELPLSGPRSSTSGSPRSSRISTPAPTIAQCSPSSSSEPAPGVRGRRRPLARSRPRLRCDPHLSPARWQLGSHAHDQGQAVPVRADRPAADGRPPAMRRPLCAAAEWSESLMASDYVENHAMAPGY